MHQFSGILRLFIFLCLIFGILCSTSDVTTNEIGESDTDLPRLEGRIVNGTRASMGRFPHQVSLRRGYSNSHFCGGSIIDKEWVLTAAHCMFRKNGAKLSPFSIQVTAGHVRLNQNDKHVQKHAVSAIIVHNAFDRKTLTNDIALLKMMAPFNLNATYVKAAKLEKKMPVPGTKCEVSGWGYLAENRTIVSNDLLFVTLPLINPLRCKKLLANVTHLPLGMFCAGYEEGLRDACQGDSGGGMICGGTLTGVVSGGEGCARPSLPGLYADVPYYHDWVTYQMRNYNESITETSTKNNKSNSSPRFFLSLSLSAIFAAFMLLSFLCSYNMR